VPTQADPAGYRCHAGKHQVVPFQQVKRFRVAARSRHRSVQHHDQELLLILLRSQRHTDFQYLFQVLFRPKCFLLPVFSKPCFPTSDHIFLSYYFTINPPFPKPVSVTRATLIQRIMYNAAKTEKNARQPVMQAGLGVSKI